MFTLLCKQCNGYGNCSVKRQCQMCVKRCSVNQKQITSQPATGCKGYMQSITKILTLLSDYDILRLFNRKLRGRDRNSECYKDTAVGKKIVRLLLVEVHVQRRLVQNVKTHIILKLLQT
jgi:hypothetical protein